MQAQPVNIFPPWVQGIIGEGSLPAAGWRPGQATLMFRLAAPLALTAAKNAPFTFVLQGRVAFKGEQLDHVSRNGNTISLEGRGKLDGKPGWRFQDRGEGWSTRRRARSGPADGAH
ncbi:hypothetical protein LP420_34990 [Massilia sp. B-10]|nr:hypothetical protein LP420_34990 [Massilia sp. B-10]UUZ53698.1 hypothetical protein LP419_34445 [Massilia sp. H-1]